MWWPIVILVFVVALALGPIMMMRPSPRQRQLARMRALAQKRGFVVRMAHNPMEGTDSGVLAIYSIPWPQGGFISPPWLLLKKNYNHDIHFYQHWDWQGSNKAHELWQSELRQGLQRLPPAIVALECNTLGLGCFWSEKCGSKSETQMVDELYGVLSDIMSSVPKDCFEAQALSN